MPDRRILGLIALASLLISAPYLVATYLTPDGAEFSGFLLNPIDGFSYLAKMRQGVSGAFEFSLPYAAEPGPGATLFVYQLGLGWLTQAIGVPPLILYHVARMAGAVLMFGLAYIFYDRAFDGAAAGRWAFALALLGSGLGWLGIGLDVLPLDLWVPEAVPLFSAYANAHFPLASALLLLVVSLIAFETFLPALKAPLAFAGGFLLGITQPFALLTGGVALLGWILLERRARLDRLWNDLRVRTLFAALAGAAPVLLYAFLATRLNMPLANWASQNLTPTPNLPATLLGYGMLLPLGAVALLRTRASAWSPAFRLLIVWAGTNLLLLYAPIPLQRRLALGLFFPLAGLAASGIQALGRSDRSQRLLLVLVLLFALPSHLLVVGAGIGLIADQDRALVLLPGESAAYQWIDQNTPAGSLILAGPTTGNRIPALSAGRVLYGHPFETPNAQASEQMVRQLYAWSSEAELGLERLKRLGVEFVVFGPEERSLGTPTWLEDLLPVFSAGQYEILQVP